MSRRTALIITVALVSGYGFYNSWKRMNADSHVKRHLKMGPQDYVAHTYKLSSGVNIEISKTSANPVVAGEPFTLEAQISSSVDLASVQYEWVLPKGVELTGGFPTGSVGDMMAGEIKSVSGTFVSRKNSNQVIQIKIMSSAGDRLAKSRYHTLNQEQIDLDRKNLLERGKQYMLDNPEKVEKSD